MNIRLKKRTIKRVCPSCKSKNYEVTRNGKEQLATGSCLNCGAEISWNWAGKGRGFN